jgi:hypothetical protein
MAPISYQTICTFFVPYKLIILIDASDPEYGTEISRLAKTTNRPVII